MNYTEEFEEKPVIIIEDKAPNQQGQGESETPVIIIEDDGFDNNTPATGTPAAPKPRKMWPWIVGSVAATLLLCIAGVKYYNYQRTFKELGVPVSYTSAENISRLEKAPGKAVTPEVVFSTDSVLGVELNFYELRGLKAAISFVEPSAADQSTYFYCQGPDYKNASSRNAQYLGTLIVQGKMYDSDTTRLGYCAMAGGNMVIGVARDEDVMEYCMEHGGDFFRQHVLVSDGVLPREFDIHGKKIRRALGRMGDKYYVVESTGKETMWDFADALREYGFNDAINLSNDYTRGFYRTADGTATPIGEKSSRSNRHKGIIPFLKFKKR